MTDYKSTVTFSAGTPIDVDDLNQLQRNLSSVYAQNTNLANTTSTDIGNIQTQVKVFPIISIGSVECFVNQNSVPVTFSNTSFTKPPVIVASIASNLDVKTSYSLRATVKDEKGANIEVVSPTTAATGQKIVVNYIAVQMKELDF